MYNYTCYLSIYLIIGMNRKSRRPHVYRAEKYLLTLYVSIYLSIYLSFYLSIHLSIYLGVKRRFATFTDSKLENYIGPFKSISIYLSI